MHAKLINGRLQAAPKRVRHNGSTIFNPPDSVLSDLGYLPVTYTDMPADASDGRHYEPRWEQAGTEIIQVWTLADDQAYPEPEPTLGDLVTAIERGLAT